jgi:hypothetical protein
MPVFSLRQAPSLRWVARTAEPCGQRVERSACDAASQEYPDALAPLAPLAPLARGTGVRATCCGLELPDGYALRLEARTHATARNPVGCPLEASALRQWCVRLQHGTCPQQSRRAAPVFLHKHA